MLTVALMFLVGATASADLVTIATTADSYIERNNTGPLDTNFGNATSLNLAWNRGSTNIYRKAYVLFDASAYAAEDITSIDSISFNLTSSNDKIIGVWFLWKTDGLDNNWIEGDGTTGITWVNAPYNDGDAFTGRAFNGNGALGENVDDLSSGGNDFTAVTGWNTYTFDHLDAARRDALLNALKTGDQKITFGLSLDNSGQVGAIASRENSLGGAYITLDVVPEPTTLFLLGLGMGLGSLTLLRRRK
ncbi:MAG: PEP-CTERM sorting domain-containing protein [Pirellulaceae bacterium]|jgi:hypothetical protein|nr:PEP-CTERM sorting domain-containing protein [Pirellulaceae bacterium]